jgi:hypothetical protein
MEGSVARIDTLQRFGDPKAGVYALCYMRVCAAADATDEEILAHANSDNPAGTEHGWSHVVRADEGLLWRGPVVCASDRERRHFIVVC